MGVYIQTPENHNKAGQLLSISPNSREISSPPADLSELNEDEVLVCVVMNTMFDAAAVVFDERELRDFSDKDDRRPRRWLVMKAADVLKLCPEAASVLK